MRLHDPLGVNPKREKLLVFFFARGFPCFLFKKARVGGSGWLRPWRVYYANILDALFGIMTVLLLMVSVAYIPEEDKNLDSIAEASGMTHP